METQHNGFFKLVQMIGLHPFVGFGMFAVDWMLFAAEAGSLGTSWVISIPVAIVLTIPCILIQKRSYGDDWGVAIGKGLLIGVLTAIPAPLPAFISLGGGALGTGKLLLDK